MGDINVVPSTKYSAAYFKVSDGKSVKVTVPASSGAIAAGTFQMYDGFLGIAMQDLVNDDVNAQELILNIEAAEYETDQINAAETFAKGTKIYWDQNNKWFTETPTGIYAGQVTVAKDANNVIWFKFMPEMVAPVPAANQADSVATDVAGIVADFNALLAKLKAAGIMLPDA